MGIVQIHVEVDPLALRGNFEFFVALDVDEVGTDEYLGDIPVPKLVGFLMSIRFRLEMQLLVRTSEQKVEIILSPARAHFCAVARVGLSERILLHVNGARGSPKWRSGIELHWRGFFCERALE